MVLKVYNTLTKRIEEFIPLNDKNVNMFVCGQTVYDDAHLGHAKTYVQFDIIVRWLRYLGYEVVYVQNITDVDDKIIIRARERNTTPKELSEFYIKRFFEDMEKLKVKQNINKLPRSMDFIPQIIEQVQELIKKGYAYVVDGNVYFDVKKFKDYTKLSGMSLEELKKHRIEPDERKKNPYDFSLWKKAKAGEISWDSPWGKGRPGWHIEDTAMTVSIFGAQYDLHGGANELIFPHHTNEIAQAESATGKKPLVKYWLHSGVLNIKGSKMSKSLGNFITIRDALKNYDPEELRLLYASTHYRGPIDYEDSMLDQAREKLNSLYNTLENVEHRSEEKGIDSEEREFLKIMEDIRKKFEYAMNDDFNTSLALTHLSELSKETNKLIDSKGSISKKLATQIITTFKSLGNVFGILEKKIEKKIPKEVEDLIFQRERARKIGDFKLSDKIRNEIRKKGYIIEDTPTGPRVRKLV